MAKKKKNQSTVPLEFQKNCIIYTRISDPNKQTEVSIAAQTRECKEFANRFGLTVIDVLEDRGTGTNLDRPQFLALQQRAKNQDFRYILVWRYDRFSRSQQDTYAAIGYFGKYGINIVPIKEQSSLEQTLEERLLASLYIAMAEYYSAELSVKGCRNMYEIAKNGLYFGGATPLGYKVVNKQLEIDELTAHIVQEAFQMYADGHQIREMCEVFNKKGYKTSYGNSFTASSFRSLLSNERYIGVYSYTATDPNGDEAVFRFEHKVPALVSEDIFNRVQEKLRLTGRGPGTGKAKVPYLLKDKIYCGLCGQSMKSDSNKKKNGDVYRYYNCRKDRPGHTCKRKTMPKDVIELNVAGRVLEMLNDPDYIDAMYEVLQKRAKTESPNKKISAMEAKIKELERSIRNAMAKITANDLGEISMSVYMRKAYEASIDRDSEALERLKSDVERQKALIRQPREFTRYDVEDWLTELHMRNLYSLEDRQHLISTYVKHVIVYDDTMEVILNCPGDVSDPQNAELTVACAKTYTDFRNENVDVAIPKELEITEDEAAAALAKLIDTDNDDDDPDGPKGGGGSKPSPSGGGSSSEDSSANPYNTKLSGTALNSADIKKSSLKQGGEPPL